MTVKESLHEAIDHMTDAEASELLARIQRPHPMPDWVCGKGDKAAAFRHWEEWIASNSDISDEEVAEYDEMLANIEPVRFREWHQWHPE